jgi:heme exporter protein A
MSLLAVEQLDARHGLLKAARNVDLCVAEGEILALVGANGAGKTTLLRVASGMLRPEQGRVAWCGNPISSVRSEYQRALAYAAHEPALKGDLTPLENLRFMAGLKRRITLPELRANLERTGVAGCADLPVRVLSAGQRRRVVMARVLAAQAAIWLLDEPFTNLDHAGSELLATMLAEHVTGGGMALVVAHHELRIDASMRRLELPG